MLSAITNEECSVTSEILDKNSEIYAAEIIQVFDSQSTHAQGEAISVWLSFLFGMVKDLESDQLGHIDSPEEISDVTEVMQGESLLDDISSVLGHDLLGAIQDITITEDTTTICGEHSRRRSIRRKVEKAEPLEERAESMESADGDPLQFGFENIVFEMDNRCDDQKVRDPSVRRYCSLAHFVEGNDIARKSFKVNIKLILFPIQTEHEQLIL